MFDSVGWLFVRLNIDLEFINPLLWIKALTESAREAGLKI